MPAKSPVEFSGVAVAGGTVAALVGGAVVTLAVSAALAFAVDLTEGRPWHSVMRPFGDADVFWATALAALPLTGLLGTRRGTPPRRRWIGLVGLLLVSWWTLATHGDAPTVVLGSLARIVPPGLARLTWIIVWQVPTWALVGPAVDTSTRIPRRAASWAAVWLVALAIPWIFAAHRADSLRRAVVRLTAQQRTWDAWLMSGRWHDLDPWSASAAESHQALTKSLSEISLRSQLPLDDQSAVADRLQRVIDLARLNQLDQAQDLVDQLERELCGGMGRAATNDSICSELSRLQADLAARRGDWQEAAERSELALQYLRLASRGEESPAQRAQEVLLVDVAADYWRRAREYERALGLIESARAVSPDRAEYAVLLGDHYRLGGQAWRATRAYESVWGSKSDVAELDAEWSARSRAGLDELVRSTPACLWVTRRP